MSTKFFVVPGLKPGAMFDRALRALVGARESAESARLAMERVADLSAPGAPLRSDLEASARDLSQAARGLRSLAELLEDKPNAILFGDRRE